MATITRTSDRDRERMRRAAVSDQGPNTEEQTGGGYPFDRMIRQLADENDPTNVSFPFLRRMRRDHMISMGLHFISMPIVKAAWYFECDNARVAAFADNLIRPIYGRLVLTVLRYLWAGYSPGAKRFEVVRPSWVYYEDGQEKQVWESDAVDAIVYKPVIPLKPELCRPHFVNGKFAGIKYDNRYGTGAFLVDGQRKKDIDLLHSMWAVHGQEDEDNSMYGFSRIAHAAPVFHMYWYIWTLLGRAFENNADPGPVVRYPKDDPMTVDENNRRVKNVTTALTIGRRKRSGSTIALPSDPYTDYTDRPSGSAKKWDIEYPKNETDFNALMDWLTFLEALKLRCVTPDTPVDCPRDYERFPDGVPISQLREGQPIWCFNERTEGFELRPLKKVGPTRPNAELLRLTLDNGREIRATPDHKFLLRNGDWVELQHLQPGDSLMPLERDFEPFVKISPNDRGWNRRSSGGREYDLVAEFLYGERPNGMVIHHQDDRHANTSPENLVYLTNGEHTTLTNQGQRRPPGFYERIVAGYEERECIDCGDAYAPRGPTSKRCETCQALERFRQLSRPRPGSKQINRPARDCQACGQSYLPTSNAQKWCPDCRAERWMEKSKADPVAPEEWLAGVSNHKVVSVDFCGREDTWDLSVDGPPECHNFVVHGVVLHNSIWVPEQGLTEGSGATSNRNVATEFGDQRNESQYVLMTQVMELIDNVFVKPALAMNMPWFEGSIKMRALGFGEQDEDTIRQMFQLAGQDDWRRIGIDAWKLAEARGYPMFSPADRSKIEEQIAAQAETSATPPVTPTQGRRAYVTQTGFNQTAYVQMGGRIELAEDGDFVQELPSSAHFADRTVIVMTRELRAYARAYHSDLYRDAARYLARADLSQSSEEIVKGWVPRPERSISFMQEAHRSLVKIFNRASALEAKPLGGAALSSEDKAPEQWLADRALDIVAEANEAVRAELKAFLDEQEEGIRGKDMSSRAREEFTERPERKANRLAQRESVRVYNFATLSTAQEAGIEKVQVLDESCSGRHAQIMDLSDAMTDEHQADCAVSYRLLKVSNLEVVKTPTMDGLMARYDEDHETVILSPAISEEAETNYMLALGESLAA